MLGLVVLEALQFTFLSNKLGPYASPVVLYLTAVALCFAAYQALRHRPWPVLQPVAVRSRWWWPAALALGVGLLLCVPLLAARISGTHPQDYSDIIPALTVYCQRLLAGEVVHRPLTEDLGYFLEPGYLPGTWLPFVVPEYFRFDYRWMSSFVLLLGLLGYLVVVVRLRRAALVTLGLSALPLLFTYAVLLRRADIFSLTVEPLVVGYYLLLVAGVLLPSRPLFVGALLLCLLSRYSVVFWVPLYLGLLYVNESRRGAWTVAGLAAAGVVAFYIVPVLSHDWGLFMRVQKVYTTTTLGEWNHLNDNGLPMHLYNGIGLTNFFYEFAPGDMLARLGLAKVVHLAASLAVVGGAALVYWRQRLPRTHHRLYAVIALKLYLTTFYAFLQVPYAYLAVVGFFTSFYLVVLVVGPGAGSPTSKAVVG
ncbi:hypothetical protein [Hymenobacter sp. IS2118]|uniref:hypothetical protein n=1 Tax=Hymenobacter sp. IS2118 TaxID=1505605 RepID=UPI00126848D9|nr:hypothetical protein [Hymenobacter sp. IS2118]